MSVSAFAYQILPALSPKWRLRPIRLYVHNVVVRYQLKWITAVVCYTLGKCTLRQRTLSASSKVSLYTPASWSAAQAGEINSPSLALLSEDLSKSLNSTADPGRRFNKMQASLTLKKNDSRAFSFIPQGGPESTVLWPFWSKTGHAYLKITLAWNWDWCSKN